MAEPLIQVDDDWKKKAREEKARLAEQAKARAAPPPQPAAPAPSARPADDEDEADEGPVGIESLAQSVLTQALLYLGMIPAAGRRMLDLDAARRQIDTLALLKEKTAGNLDADETAALDVALHDARSRFTAVASQMIM